MAEKQISTSAFIRGLRVGKRRGKFSYFSVFLLYRIDSQWNWNWIYTVSKRQRESERNEDDKNMKTFHVEGIECAIYRYFRGFYYCEQTLIEMCRLRRCGSCSLSAAMETLLVCGKAQCYSTSTLRDTRTASPQDLFLRIKYFADEKPSLSHEMRINFFFSPLPCFLFKMIDYTRTFLCETTLSSCVSSFLFRENCTETQKIGYFFSLSNKNLRNWVTLPIKAERCRTQFDSDKKR